MSETRDACSTCGQGVCKECGRSTEREDLLRVAFVEMLFALVVADVAVHTSELAQAAGAWWPDKVPALAHLGLGLWLIAASWVGWRQSPAPGMKSRVYTVFSLPFVGLLLDVLIVIMYYVLVRSVEVGTRADEPVLAPASAVPESLALCVVFGLYAVWDLAADVLPRGTVPWTSTREWLAKVLLAATVSTFASMASLGLCASVYWVAGPAARPKQVVCLDAALACAVGLFRLFKLAEQRLARRLGVGDLAAFKGRPGLKRNRYVFAGLAAGYVLFVALAVLL